MSDLIERVLAALFPADSERAAARDALARYGSESYQPEPDRVRLAVLKLCDGNLEKLASLVQTACTDFRDVVMWAEYPEEGRHAPEALLDDPVTKRHFEEARQRDRAQYEQWLARFATRVEEKK
jgi:hypothetical protein